VNKMEIRQYEIYKRMEGKIGQLEREKKKRFE
jgi:hypothetical protein